MDADNDLIGVPRFVMVILAEYVNHKNGDQHCWPALGAIAQRAGLSTRQAQRILRDLESQGYLRIELGTGRNHTNRCNVYIK